MTDNEQFDRLMRLADFRFLRWRERRGLESKMTYAFWTTLIAAGAYLRVHNISVPPSAAFILLSVAAIAHAFFVRTNWISNQTDILNAFHFSERAENILEANSVKPEKRWKKDEYKKCYSGCDFLRHGICQVQVFTSAFMALCIWGLLTFTS